MANSSTFKVNLALFLAIATWSLSFVAIRIALTGYSPGALALLRFSLASFCLGVFFLKQPKPKRITKRHSTLFLCAGVIGLAGYSLLLNSGEKSVSSGLASFIIAQTPIITACLAIAFLNERPALVTIIAIAISCLGITIIVIDQPVHTDSNLGLMLVIFATACGSIHTIVQKRLLSDLSPYHVTTFSTWIAAIALLVFLPDLIIDLRSAPTDATLAVVFLGTVPSTIGQWLWSYGLSRTMVVRASAYLYAIPIISTAFGWIILSEIPSRYALIGGLTALAGAMLVKKDLGATRQARKSAKPS